jgi:hypothetical protein
VGAVRLSPPVTILTLTACALAWMAINRPPPPTYDEQCAVVAAFDGIDRLKPDIFSGTPLRTYFTRRDLKELNERHGHRQDAQEASRLLARSIARKPIDPLVVCKDLTERLRSRQISYDRRLIAEALDYRRAKKKSPNRPIYVMAMRLPLISSDGKTALVEMTYSYAGFESGSIALWRKDLAGRWNESTQITSWIT